MSSESEIVARIEHLIKKSEAVLKSHVPNPPNVIGFSTLDATLFGEWRNQSISCLESLLGPEHNYVQNFKSGVKEAKVSQTKTGIGILKAAHEDLINGFLNQPKVTNPVLLVEQICSRFHLLARQLRSRYDSRPTINVQDEYDVQDLIHALLLLHFDDIRPEEYTPSYAGKSSRMDFLLKNENVVVELKKTRPGLGAKELGAQLIEDIQRYKTHPNCKTLICFVYDPDGYIPNPRGIETDLSRADEQLFVSVVIRP